VGTTGERGRRGVVVQGVREKGGVAVHRSSLTLIGGSRCGWVWRASRDAAGLKSFFCEETTTVNGACEDRSQLDRCEQKR
jgi:hypothetical protein